MANVVRDPKVHPEAVLADFTKAESPGDVRPEGRWRLCMGAGGSSGSLRRCGDDYFVQPAQWDVAGEAYGCRITWRRGRIGGCRIYGETNQERPTGRAVRWMPLA